MRQVNFVLMFTIALALVLFSLENTSATTVRFLPGVSATMPLAVMLLMVAGIGATFAWVFAVWAGVIRRVEDQVAEKEAQAQQVRIQDMQQDLDRYKATLDAQLGLLPASVERSESISSDN